MTEKLNYGKENNSIKIDNFSNADVTINDSIYIDPSEASKNDRLYLNTAKKGDGAFLFFDVAANESNQPNEYSPNLYITKNSNILNYMKPKFTPGLISIENWFADRNVIGGISSGSGVIEKIYFNNGELSVNDYITRVTNDVRTELNKINKTINNANGKFKSAMEVLERGTKAQKQTIINCYTKENAEITLKQHSEGGKITFNGSNGNDVITTANDYIINAGKGDDKLLKGLNAKNYILNGEDGNDVLQAGNNSIVNGGKGENAIIVDDNSSVTITQGKGKDYIHLVDSPIEDYEFTKNGKDLIMKAENGSKITLKDYFKYNTKFSVKGIDDSTTCNLNKYANQIITSIKNASNGNSIENLLGQSSTELNIIDNPTKNSIKGTAYNDNIDASTLKNLTRGLTIDGGKGNDEIYGTKFADTIKGGNGENELFGGAGDDKIYANTGNNLIEGNKGNDKIYCEKGNSEIRFYLNDGDDIVYSGKSHDTIAFEDININEISFGLNKKDLVINYGNKGDSVTLSNYFKKNGNTSVKTIYTKDCASGVNLNLHMETANITINGLENKKNKITGTFLSDTITGKNLNDTLNGGKGNDTIYGNSGNDNIKGGDGDDSLYGGANNDTINGGNGWDEIYGGRGNDKLYGEAGTNGFHFYNGDGNDTIYMGKGVDRIYLENSQTNAPTYERSGNNLIINYGNNDSITVSNYFKSKNPSVKSINYNGITDNLSGNNGIIINGVTEYEYGYKLNYFCGNDKNNLIYAASNFDEVDTGDGNNTVYINSKKEAGVFGGFGDDTYYVNSLKKYVYLNDAGGSDKLVINDKAKNINILFDVNADNSDVYGNSSMLILNDSNYNKIKKTRSLEPENISSAIEVVDGVNELEYIYTKDNKVITGQELASIKQDVVNWLNSSQNIGNHDSALSVLINGSSHEINSLLAVYQQGTAEALIS